MAEKVEAKEMLRRTVAAASKLVGQNHAIAQAQERIRLRRRLDEAQVAGKTSGSTTPEE